MNPGLDIIVINYRTPSDLRHFLSSLADHPPSVPYTVWIGNVDPNPDDVVVASVAHRAALVNYDTNVGYNHAVNDLVNQSFGAATRAGVTPAPYIGIFNADVTITPGALDLLLADLEHHSDAAVVGPRQTDPLGRITAGGIFGTDTNPKHRAWQQTSGADDIRDDSIMIAGSAMIWRRTAWDELTRCDGVPAKGALAPCFHYYGETWACYHARAHGWKLLYDGTVTIGHAWHQASKVGGAGEQALEADQAIFRALCDNHQPPIRRD